MNEIFDFKRFGAFALRSWALYGKKYLVTAGILAGAMVLLMAAVCASNRELRVHDLSDLTPFYVVITVVYFFGFTVTVMNPFKNRKTLVMENTVPASTTEKWLFILGNTTVVAAVFFLVAASLTVLTGVAISGWAPFGEYFRSDSQMEPWRMLPLLLLPLQAITMYGGTMERRNHRLSVLLAGATFFAAILAFMLFPMWLSDKLDMTMQYGPLFGFGHAFAESGLSRVNYTGGWDSMFGGESLDRITTWGCIATTLLFWICSWFNFRERSIK